MSMGDKPSDITAIAVAASLDDYSPCGACRQVLAEFGENIQVIFEDQQKPVVATVAERLADRLAERLADRLAEGLPYRLKRQGNPS